jgi:hypothetical protein
MYLDDDDPWSSRIGQCQPDMTYSMIGADEGKSLELQSSCLNDCWCDEITGAKDK